MTIKTDLKAYKDVYVFVQQVDNIIDPVSYELICKGVDLAATLGCRVVAVLPGYNVRALCPKLARYGADKVVLIDDEALVTYMTEPYTRAVAAVVEHYKPEVVLYGATSIGRDLAPRVSARVHTGLTADCTALAVGTETGGLLMTRPAFGGNIMATIVCPEHRPQMATVRPGVMKCTALCDGRTCPVEEFAVPGLAEGKNVEILEVIQKVTEKMDIMDARVLVSGGRGMGGPENFPLLEELARELGGTVAASRAAVDAGWQPKERQVGQTGKTVRPNLYIACGISGAIQHLAGMEGSDVIIAVNRDPAAPIFEVADYGVVADAVKLVPLLTAAVQKLRREKAAQLEEM